MNSQDWTHEVVATGEVHSHQIVRRLHTERSQFQKIEVLETAGYGVGLFSDGRIQHVAGDEYIYSETIIHPAALLLGDHCKRALIVGGGPGGAIRELLRHRSIETITQVEIDPTMIDVSRRFFPHISQGCWEDPRVRLEIADISDFLARNGERFDLIIYDVSEPMKDTPASNLFSSVFFTKIRAHLSERGIFVTWAGSVGPRSHELAASIHRAMETAFPHVMRYVCSTQSYGTSWLTLGGSNHPYEPLQLGRDAVDRAIADHIQGTLRFYDGTTHLHMFNLPKDVRAALAQAPEHATGAGIQFQPGTGVQP
ncbi:hypothetical protein ACN28S_41015 [Cystobacter fuscus]